MNAPARARVLLADDHGIVAEGVAMLLRDAFDLVGLVRDGTELIEAAMRLRPDVIVADISMPGKSGFEAMRALAAAGKPARFVFLTMHDDPRLMAEALRGGAAGYVAKHLAGEDLVRTIERALSGAPMVRALPSASSTAGASREVHLLTPRQRDVLKLIARGKTMKEIGRALDMSPRTVETHKYAMMKVLQIAKTADLVQFAVRVGMTDDP